MRALTSAAAWVRRHPDTAAVAVLVGVLCAFFAPLFTGHQLGQSHILYETFPWVAERPADLTLAPREDEGDAALHYHPILALARRQLHDGELPLWNPSSYTGMPLFGDMQSALLFPLTWLALALPVEVAFGWMALLKLLIAGLGAYALARRLGAGSAGALVAALVYALSAPLVLWVQHMLGTELALLPWLLLATERLAAQPDRRGIALLAAMVTLSVFAGHPETAALNTLAAAVYLLARVARERSRWRAAGGFAAAHALGLAGGAVAIAPFAVAYADSITRVAHDGAGQHLPLSWLITYALPTVFGDGRPEWWGPVGVIFGGYFGMAAALLAGVGLVRHRRDRRLIALAVSAVFMAMVAFDVPPVSWIVGLLPVYGKILTLRVAHVVALAGAVAAGLAVHSLMTRPLARRAALAWAAGAVAAGGVALVLALFAGVLRAPRSVEVEALVRFLAFAAAGVACLLALGRLRRPLAVVLVVAVVVGDLSYLRGHNVLLPPEQAYPSSTPGIRFLQAQRKPFTVSTIRVPGERGVLPPNTASLYGLESIQGYDVPQPKRWADLSYSVLGERGPGGAVVWYTPPPRGPALTALRMLNTRYVLAAPGTPPPDPSLEVAYSGSDLTVFRDPHALPRAYVVSRTRALGDREALEVLRRGALDPAREALVPPGEGVAPGGPARPARPARFERLGSDHVRVHLPAGAGGWLIVAQSYSRQWNAEADRRPVPAFPTNYAATGLRVTPGMRTIDLRYDRTAETAGAAVSAVALALMALLALGRPPLRGARWLRSRGRSARA